MVKIFRFRRGQGDAPPGEPEGRSDELAHDDPGLAGVMEQTTARTRSGIFRSSGSPPS